MLAQNLDAIQSGAGINAPDNIGPLIGAALPYVFGIAGFLLLIYLVLGGFQMMTSRGEPKTIAGAQSKITNALIGFVIILISAGIVIILGKLLKVDFGGIF